MKVDVVERPRGAAGGVGLGIGQLGNVERVQTVHVLVLQDGVQDQALVDVCRQGQLHEDAVNLGICTDRAVL